ncbi:hypothetical protein BN3660_01425 [Eubacteriaceae bacterium CHKCI004]|nr:hypothetical protein BN3660_01425 [Eubacteriaceae bacterium CHKCI004]
MQIMLLTGILFMNCMEFLGLVAIYGKLEKGQA